jgi:hypothetical protein
MYRLTVLLDGEQEIGRSLDLVDHHRRVDIDETGGIFLRCLADALVVERLPHRLTGGPGQPDECAFAALARAVDQNHPGIGQGLVNGSSRMARHEPSEGSARIGDHVPL